MTEDPPAAAAPEPIRPHRRLLTRWWAVLPTAAGLTVLVAALLAAGLSRAMWGYWFVRPGVDPRVLGAREVRSVTWFSQMQQPDGSWALARYARPYEGPGWYEREKTANPGEYDYYLLERRALLALERRGVISGPVPAAETLPDLAALIRPTLAAEARGYETTLQRPRSGPDISGAVYELSGASGEWLLLVAFSGCSVANDHYPYYELLFRAPEGAAPEPLSTTRFCFDIAGFEGVEFPQMFRFFALAGLALVLPTAGATLLLSGIGPARRRHRRRRGLCPGCAYDLRGVPGPCPECGSPR